MNYNEVLQQMDPRYALFGLFFAFSNTLQAAGDSFYEEITCKQFFLLACMSLFPEEAPTANELAKVMGCTRQNVKEILNSLEKKGYVRLEADPTDKRKKRVFETDAIRMVAEKYREKEEQFMAALYHDVSEEDIHKVFAVINHMTGNLVHMEDKNN